MTIGQATDEKATWEAEGKKIEIQKRVNGKKKNYFLLKKSYPCNSPWGP
jgi:hypothetical protein